MLKLTKIIFEYSDGAVRTLSGKIADTWFHKTNSIITFALARGIKYPKFNWKETKKKKVETK